jgi:hypothetical protein
MTIRVAAQQAAAELGKQSSAAIKTGQISREALFDRSYVSRAMARPLELIKVIL